MNASRDFSRGRPKHLLTENAIVRIAEAFTRWVEEPTYSRIVDSTEIAENDFNISPSRYVLNADEAEHNPIEFIAKQLENLDEQSRKTNEALRQTLKKLLNANTI